MVLRECTKDEDFMRIIEELNDGRLIWSLFKNDSQQVQANAAWSLMPYIKYAQDSGEMVRSFVGGLKQIICILKSQDENVLSCVCATISEIAQDRENVGVITDHGVAPMLVNLVHPEGIRFREHLTSAIAYCYSWDSNCKMFERLGAIISLVVYMASQNSNVQRSTALALYHSSKNPFNCITMHESSVIPRHQKTKSCKKLPRDALVNIQRLALEVETFHLVARGKKPESDEDDEN